MTPYTAVQIMLPDLTPTEAAHLHEVLYDLLLIIDAYYGGPDRRVNDPGSHQNLPCRHCPWCRHDDRQDQDDELPF